MNCILLKILLENEVKKSTVHYGSKSFLNNDVAAKETLFSIKVF